MRVPRNTGTRFSMDRYFVRREMGAGHWAVYQRVSLNPWDGSDYVAGPFPSKEAALAAVKMLEAAA